MKIQWIIIGFLNLLIHHAHAQSVNVAGNYEESYRISRLQKIQDGYMAFGTSKALSVQHFSFEKGNDWSLSIKQKSGNNKQTVFGTGGLMENDSTMVLLGRLGTAEIIVLKVTIDGNIIWANSYSTGTDEHPDKIVRLKNGDYLISVRTNVSYYEFGEWGSRSAVLRISENGNLKWCRWLDYRTANTGSVVLGMFETPGQNILIAQSYNSNLGLFKLNADGDSLKSLLSNQNFVGEAADGNAESNRLYVVSPDKKILCLDTNLNVIWQKEIASTSLNSTADIRILGDSMLTIGGKYQNQGCILFTDLQAVVQQAQFKTYYPSSPSTLRHLEVIHDTLYSLISPGWAITAHSPGGPTCFNNANGATFSTSTMSALTFKPHIKIGGSATYSALTNLIAETSQVAYPVRNCLNFDLSVQTEKMDFYETCQYGNPRIWVTNQGTNVVNSLKVRYSLNGIWHDSTYNISALGTKSSAYIYLGDQKYYDSVNIYKGFVYAPNGQQDAFSLNDSFQFTNHTRVFKVLKISGKDTICEGVTNRLEVKKYPGLYDWYRDGKLILKEAFFNYNSAVPGAYHCILNDSFCNVYSDTFIVTSIPSPVIRRSGDTLWSDVTDQIYWFYNSNRIDSFTHWIIAKSPGKYWAWLKSCNLISNQINITTGNILNPKASHFKVLESKILFWGDDKPADIIIYSLDGRMIRSNHQLKGLWDPKLPSGIYVIKVSVENEVFWEKAWLTQ